MLIAELQHRTRNLLAIVQSIAQQTVGRGASLQSFNDRLAALGRVQSLVSGAMKTLYQQALRQNREPGD